MSKETQQTAVEWIEELFYSKSKQVGFSRWVILESDMDRIINKAKEKQKQQSINDFVAGNKLEFYDGTEKECAEHYYNETYGGDK